MRQLLQILDEGFDQRNLIQIMRDLVDRQHLDLGLGDTVDSARHHRANRLGCAPAAMVARRQRGVWLQRQLDGVDQLGLERLDALQRRHPALDGWRLDDNQFDFFCAFKSPCRFRRTDRSRSVEEKLVVFFGRHSNAVAKLPIQNNSTVAKAANEISRAENVRQKIAKTNSTFDCIFGLPFRVYLVQRRQRDHQLIFDQVFGQHAVVQLRADQRERIAVRLQHLRNRVVQERAFVGVAAAGLRRHLVH